MRPATRDHAQSPLPGPFALRPDAAGVKTTPAVSRFVATQVRALLDSSPAFYELANDRREAMRNDLEKIATYTAALIQDEWASSERIGQTPMLRQQTSVVAP